MQKSHFLRESGKCSDQQIEDIRKAFSSGDRTSFTFRDNGATATGYAVGLNNEDWVLIRDFPPAASTDIINNANRNGIRLIATLLTLFFIYIVLFTIAFIRERQRMRIEARNANYVSSGVSRLFEKFMTLSLSTGRYEYIVDGPNDESLPREGDYSIYTEALLGLIDDDKNHDIVKSFITIDNLRDVLRNQEAASVRVHAPNGDEEWYTFNFIVLERTKDGEADLLLVLSQDTTALYNKEIEEQRKLQEALDRAESASKAKTEFLFNMSHDLRTPMNAIIGYTELAGREDADAGQMHDYIGKIDSASKHLLALINDILEMSRIESGKMTLEPEDTDIVSEFRDIEGLFRTQMEGKSIDFIVETDVTDRWVSCDRIRLGRVAMNLISNAFKFTDEGGRVSVSLTETGSDDEKIHYEFRVKDNGIGMSSEFASRLFRPFERERTSTVSGIQGTGLGLSISKSIIDLMGGTIDVNTEQGKGTEFIVRVAFDRAEDKAEIQADTAKPAREIDFSSMRLLLAEDNMINREIASMILTDAGFSLETAENGREALDKVAGSEPGYYDAVLMDIQMPEMNGYEATAAIRSLDNRELAGIPIVAMTANAFKEDVDAAIEAGMNGHIAKPIDIPVMLETLTNVLSGRKNK